jgi:hypothetical protein
MINADLFPLLDWSEVMNFPNITPLDVFLWLMRADLYIANVWWIFIGLVVIAALGGRRYRKNLRRRHDERDAAEQDAILYDQQYPDTYRDN